MKGSIKVLAVVLMAAFIRIPVMSQNKAKTGCDALFPVTEENGKDGYINHKGQIVVKPQFVSALDFNEGVGVVWITDEETGYVDLQGKLMTLPGVEIFGGKFSDGLAAAVVNDKVGYVNKSGKMIFQVQDRSTNHVFSFSEGLVPVLVNEEFYFYNTKGELAINRGFGSPSGDNDFVDGMATVMVDGAWAVIDRHGNYIAPPRKDGYSAPSEGLVNFNENGSTIYIDKSGKTVLKVPYRRAGGFSEGLAWFLQNDKWGYIDKTGKVVVEPKFDSAAEFSEGLAAVGIDNKVGFINRKGELVVRSQFDFVFHSFKCGLAKVKKNDKEEGYINRNGNWVWKRPNLLIRKRNNKESSPQTWPSEGRAFPGRSWTTTARWRSRSRSRSTITRSAT